MKNFNITYNMTYTSGYVANDELCSIRAANEAEAKKAFIERQWYNSTQSVEFVSIKEFEESALDRMMRAEYERLGNLMTAGD